MFWGLKIKSNKRYSQTVAKPFHLSQIALDTSSAKPNEDIQVFITIEQNTFLLCTLKKDVINQASLSLDFAVGEKLSFSTKGTGIVHLTGYLIPEDDMFMGDSDEEGDLDLSELQEESDEEEEVAKSSGALQKGKKNIKLQESVEDDEDDDDDDENDDEEGEDDSEEDEDEEDDDEDDDDVEDEDDEIPPQKKQKLVSTKQQNGLENGKLSHKEQKKEKQQQPQQQKQKNQQGGANIPKKTLQGGVIIEDVKVGAGAEAKGGKKVLVYYEGKLKENNRIFDSTKIGPGFKFILGRGEVISGWDIGVAGMKVGGKRRITCPPKMAYGAKGSPPVIPPNSTLVFDVELKNVI